MRAQREHSPGAPGSPSFAVLTERAARIAEHAESLARAGREDEAAADALRRLAHGRQRPLAQAAQLFKVNGEHREVRWHNRAVRLLDAVASGAPVAPEGPCACARFDLLERLRELPPDQAFHEMAAREPRLLALREQLLSARDGASDASPFTRWLRVSALVHHQLVELVELVGHARPEFDPLCSAAIAYAIASAYLAELAFSGS